MSTPKLILPAAAIVVGAGALWLQYSLNERLRSDNEVLRGALAQMKQFQEVQKPVAGEGIMKREQLDELLKLRNEVTRLREETNKISALAEANQKLVASLKEAKAPPKDIQKKKGPEDALPQDIHPRSSWAFRGFATPEAAVESFFWGQVNGNRTTLMEAFSPEMLPKVEEELEGKNLAEEARKIKTEEFRIVDRQQLSDDEVVLNIYTARHYDDGQFRFDNFNPTVFQRIGGEWKFTDKHAPDN